MPDTHTQPCPTSPDGTCQQVSLGRFIDRSGLVGEIEVRRCTCCGHAVSLPPIPDVAFLYDNRQSQDYQPDAGNSVSKAIKDIAFRIQARRLLRDMAGTRGRLLDYGCGSGQFTRVLGETAGDLEVYGSDFFAEAPVQLAGRPYLTQAEVAQESGRFDAVIAMHVLEHDDDTQKLLQTIVAPARPGGTVVVEVPNVDCVWAGVFGRYWDAWYLPYHRHHFSRASLAQALQAGGLEVQSIRGVTAPTMGRTIANLASRKNNLFWILVGIALHPVQLAGEFLTGRKTALRAVCRKPA